MELYSVLITGANRGIGLEFVRQILQLETPPKHVFATYRSSQNLEPLESLKKFHEEKTSLHLLKLDVTKTAEVEKAKDFIAHAVKEKGLTLLINNAGVAEIQAFPNITVENLNYHFSTNTVAPIIITQAMHSLLKLSAARQRGGGMSFTRAGVLNMTSLVASLKNTGEVFTDDLVAVSYKISKAGLNMAMRVIASSMKADNVLVVNMCPGFVKTDMAQGRGEITPKESISNMLKTLATLNESHTGLYMDRNAQPYPF